MRQAFLPFSYLYIYTHVTQVCSLSYSVYTLVRKNRSGDVTKDSIAPDPEEGVFTWSDPEKIAASLKNSADVSVRRKATPFQSAMSMLNFFINRAGRNLPEERKKILEQAKAELRKLYGKI